MSRPTKVAVFRRTLGLVSERFIADQAAAMTRFQPLLVGLQGNAWDERVPTRLLGGGGSTLRREALLVGRRPRRRWIEELGEEGPAIWHSHFGTDAVWSQPIASRLGLPLVATFHGMDFAICRGSQISEGGWHYPLYVARRRFLFEQAAAVIAVSEYTAERLSQLGMPRNRIHVVPMGIDTNAFHPPSSDRLRAHRVVFVGRLVRTKGCDWLIEAMKLVQSRLPDVDLVVIGEGPERASLQALASDLGVRVTFTGALDRGQIRSHLASASALCLPSVPRPCGCGEAFGLALLEAQAMGVPVVATRVGGIPEALEDGVTGFLVAPGIAREMENRLTMLLSDEALTNKMGEAAIERTRKLFDIRTTTAALETVYDRVLAVDPRGRPSGAMVRA